MSRRNNDYRDMPFSSEISYADFFTYSSIADLVISCEMNKEMITKIRTIGVISSISGRFFIKDIDSLNKSDSPEIQVSMAYVKSSLQSPIIPYTVQIFGTMQWRGRPVIFAKLVQVLNTKTAIRLNDAMKNICSNHLAWKSEVSEHS